MDNFISVLYRHYILNFFRCSYIFNTVVYGNVAAFVGVPIRKTSCMHSVGTVID
jgi:hypothetical protein